MPARVREDSFGLPLSAFRHILATIFSLIAGRYQLLARYFDAYKLSMALPDFAPHSQDLIALQQIKECRALDDIEAGKLQSAVRKCAHIWASLPGAGYGQHENNMENLQASWRHAGMTLVVSQKDDL